jgi:RimJ/RimL family protein N-acetyltransferase
MHADRRTRISKCLLALRPLHSYFVAMIIDTPTGSIIKSLHENYKRDLFDLANDEQTALLSSHWEPLEWENHCEWFDKRMKDENFLVMIIAPQGKFLGHVDLKRINQQHKHAEIAIAMNQQPRGKGIGTRALKEMVQIGFDALNLNKIYTYTRSDNIPAIKAYEKAGFQKEATLRKERLIAGTFYDFDIMSTLRVSTS